MLPDAGANDVGKMIGNLANGRIAFSLDHDSQQCFSSGIAYQHPPRPIEGGFGGSDRLLNIRDLILVRLMLDLYVEKDLRNRRHRLREFRQGSAGALHQ